MMVARSSAARTGWPSKFFRREQCFASLRWRMGLVCLGVWKSYEPHVPQRLSVKWRRLVELSQETCDGLAVREQCS